MVTVSVPGKVHLMGEHAVVYGKPALLAAVNLRMRVRVELVTKTKDKQRLKIISSEPVDYVQHAVRKVQEHLQLSTLPLMRITIDSNIPSGYHLGSSAAVAVGVVGALTFALKKVWNPQAINQLAFEIEKKQHGNPSGGDNTAVTMGGFVWYRKELDFLKSMWQLPFKLPKALNHFYLIDTGRPKETTGEMVLYVRSRLTVHSSQTKKLFDINEEQVRKIAVAIHEENEKELINGMRLGERTLEGIGVVSKKVIPFIRDIELAGGAAKILGGGGIREGVGFLLVYHQDAVKLARIAQTYTFSIQPVEMGGEGVRLERK